MPDLQETHFLIIFFLPMPLQVQTEYVPSSSLHPSQSSLSMTTA